MQDRREKVLARFAFWESIIFVSMFSVFCAILIEKYFAPKMLEPYGWQGLALMLFLCCLGIIKCVTLLKRKKSRLIESRNIPVYEHETWGKCRRELGRVLFLVLLLLFWILFSAWHFQNLLSSGHPPDLRIQFLSVAWITFHVLNRLCRLLYGTWGYEPKIKVALSEQELYVSHPFEDFLSSDTAFSLDEIADARIVIAEDSEALPRVISPSGFFIIDTNVKIKRGPYMYAFFLSHKFPLPDGHQVVELKLQNGRHVLIETDDAENFLVALKKCGVGVGRIY